MPPVLTRPAELVPSRLLAAEACASAALALVQSPALWEALHTLGMMLAAADEFAEAGELGGRLAELLADAATTDDEAATAVALVESVDRTARMWAALSHPGARLGLASVPLLGPVT